MESSVHLTSMFSLSTPGSSTLTRIVSPWSTTSTGKVAISISAKVLGVNSLQRSSNSELMLCSNRESSLSGLHGP